MGGRDFSRAVPETFAMVGGRWSMVADGLAPLKAPGAPARRRPRLAGQALSASWAGGIRPGHRRGAGVLGRGLDRL